MNISNAIIGINNIAIAKNLLSLMAAMNVQLAVDWKSLCWKLKIKQHTEDYH